MAACLAALSLTAGASPAAASETIGQLAPGSPAEGICNTSQADILQPTVTSGNGYVVRPQPPAGVLAITSWSTNASADAGQRFTMKIFRPVAGPSYMVVGHEGPRSLTGGTINTFPASIAVKPGDVLGLNFNDGSAVNSACIFDVPDSILFRAGSLGDGAQGDFTSISSSRVNVTAVVAPSSAFSLGKVSRNKKKGTATITATVPNPGELAGSGKGVKVAGAAGAQSSRTVAAPGEVRMVVKARGKKRRTLNQTGKVKVKPKITYTPTGGDPSTQSRKLKLKKL